MWFFKRQKKTATERDFFSNDPELTNMPLSPDSNTPEYKRIESLFKQADKLYAQAMDILKEQNPGDLDEESRKRYFDLLIESYNKLLSRADDKELYFSCRLSVQIERLLLVLHRDIALCYSKGIGVAADDYERRRHLEVEGLLYFTFHASMDYEPSKEFGWRRMV